MWIRFQLVFWEGQKDVPRSQSVSLSLSLLLARSCAHSLALALALLLARSHSLLLSLARARTHSLSLLPSTTPHLIPSKMTMHGREGRAATLIPPLSKCIRQQLELSTHSWGWPNHTPFYPVAAAAGNWLRAAEGGGGELPYVVLGLGRI